MSLIQISKTIQPIPAYNSKWTLSLKSGGGGDSLPEGMATSYDNSSFGTPTSSVRLGYTIGKQNFANPDSDPLHPTHYELNSRASTTVFYNLATAIAELIASYDPLQFVIAGMIVQGTGFAGLGIDPYKISFNPPSGGIGDEYPTIDNLTSQGITSAALTTPEYLKFICQNLYKNGVTANQGFYIYDTKDETNWGEKLSGAWCPFAPGVTSAGHTIECRFGPSFGTLTLTLILLPTTDLGDYIEGGTEPAEVEEVPELPNEEDEYEPEDAGLHSIKGSKGSSAGTDLPQWGFEALQEFDYLYIPNNINVSELSGVIIGVGVVGGSSTGYGLTHTNLYVEKIKISMTEADYMSFTERDKYDAVGLFDVGDRVFGMILGTVVFSGYIRSKTRVINNGEQCIKYEASGIREWLYDLPFCSTFKAKEYTIPTIFNTILNAIPPILVNSAVSSALPTDELHEFTLEGASLGTALDALFDQSGTCAWYIGTDKVLRVYDLTNLTSVNIAMPAEGTPLSASYNVLSKDLSIDTTNCKTRCILEGDYPYYEKTQTVSCNWKTETIGENTGMVATLNLNKEILSTLLSDTGSRPKVYVNTNKGLVEYEVIFVNCLTGQIKFVKTSADQGMYTQVTVQYVEKGAIPIRYDTGWVGTAYTEKSVQRVMVRKDSRFQFITGAGDNNKNTQSLMPAYAAKLIAPYKDWKLGGSVVLDGLNLTVGMGKCINFTGTTEDWTDINAAIIAITWDLTTLTTTIELTNNYFMGTSVPDPIFEQNKIEREKYSKIVQLREAERNNLTNF